MGHKVRLHDKEFEIFITSEKIQARIAELAAQINHDFAGKRPLFVGVLNGAFLFAADLFKHLDIECEITFVKVSSYIGTSSTGKVKEIIGLNEDVAGRDIVFIEDIIDTGDTVKFLLGEVSRFKPANIYWASMLSKPECLRHELKIDYMGFEVPNKFLVGYGLDYDGIGRNLNDLYIVKEVGGMRHEV